VFDELLTMPAALILKFILPEKVKE
jgi:hypothetical protein